jgi:hypothetical protein
MRLLIANEGMEPHAEYTNKFLAPDGSVDLSDVSQNECVEIVLSQVLNQLTIDQIVPFLTQVSGKLRKGGKLYINGVSLRTICRRLLKYEIDDVQINGVFHNTKSILSISTVKGIINQLDIEIHKIIINGENYEIICTR